MISPTQKSRITHAYGLYYVIPMAAGCVWLAGLLALIGSWAHAGTPTYGIATQAPILFISDIGAEYQKLFIGICVVTSALYILSLFLERWLRHVDRIPAHGDHNKKIVIYDILAVIFCILGSIALILLSCFNDIDYSTVHWICTCVFILCIAISAIFQSLEIFNLKKDHPERAHLMRNALLKLAVVFSAIIGAIIFAVLYSRCHGSVDYTAAPSRVSYCKKVSSAAAVFEWIIALIFDAYLFTLVLDLWPASKTSPRFLRRLERTEQTALDKMGVNNPGSTRHSTTSAGTNAEWNHNGGTNQMAEVPNPHYNTSRV